MTEQTALSDRCPARDLRHDTRCMRETGHVEAHAAQVPNGVIAWGFGYGVPLRETVRTVECRCGCETGRPCRCTASYDAETGVATCECEPKCPVCDRDAARATDAA